MNKSEAEVNNIKKPRRVLFFSEAVTLAHVARPLVLAQSLNRTEYESHIAWSSRYSRLFPELTLPEHELFSIDSEAFSTNLSRGTPLYDVATLRRYVQDDLKIIDAVKPDIIVGDFRLSLSVSARLAQKPYISISNIYWSPYSKPDYVVPELPVTRLLGPAVAQFMFERIRPMVFAFHSLPINRVRSDYGLPKLGYDLRKAYTDADYTFYADIPGLSPVTDLPDNHCILGPILWSPSIAYPDWWREIPQDKPIIYVTLGSSGESVLLPVVFRALSRMPLTVIAATAGRVRLESVPDNVFISEYLPGNEAAAMASLVICNGGSPTTQQALAAGVPVLGIPSNLDQYLNMTGILDAECGEQLRSGQVSEERIRAAVERLLHNIKYRKSANAIKKICVGYNAGKNFAERLSAIA